MDTKDVENVFAGVIEDAASMNAGMSMGSPLNCSDQPPPLTIATDLWVTLTWTWWSIFF